MTAATRVIMARRPAFCDEWADSSIVLPCSRRQGRRLDGGADRLFKLAEACRRETGLNEATAQVAFRPTEARIID